MKNKLAGIFKRRGTIMIQEANDNSELIRRLRAWKITKKNAEDKAYEAKLAQCEVDLDESETKIMILKLLQTEKMLAEVRRHMRKYNRAGFNETKKAGVPSARGSRMGRADSNRSGSPVAKRQESRMSASGTGLGRRLSRVSSKPKRLGMRNSSYADSNQM